MRSGTARIASDRRLEEKFVALGLPRELSAALVDIFDDFEPCPVPVPFFFSEKPLEKVSERLKGIFERSGRRTGADAQMTPRSISTAAAIQSGYAYL